MRKFVCIGWTGTILFQIDRETEAIKHLKTVLSQIPEYQDVLGELLEECRKAKAQRLNRRR